jgi:hypothetical protein
MQLRTKTWWAVVTHPAALPVLLPSRAAARHSRLPGEHVVPVKVTAVDPRQRALKLPTIPKGRPK